MDKIEMVLVNFCNPNLFQADSILLIESVMHLIYMQ